MNKNSKCSCKGKEFKSIINSISEIKIDKNYTFRGKSSQLTNSVLVLSKNDGKINKGPFVPNTIEQKNTKEEMESFDEMFDKLNE